MVCLCPMVSQETVFKITGLLDSLTVGVKDQGSPAFSYVVITSC